MKYMVGIDGSKASMKAFEMALSMASPGDDEIFILTAVKESKDSETLDKVLFEANQTCKSRGFECTLLWTEADDPREAICKAVEKNNIEVLCLGRRGLNKLQRLFLGSVSDYCSKNANCSVLIAHENENEH